MDANGLKIGTILKGNSHNYRIDKILGSGSFGITYLADVIFGETATAISSLKVTIKEFFMKDFNGREGTSVTVGSKDGCFGKYLYKFNQEAKKLSMVESAGVVKVLELFQANNTSYYVMQYLSGGSLNDLISNRRIIPERYALQLCLQIANALNDIHGKKMLHLDLKPSNVMLTSAGDAVLIDFGLSKQYTENGEPESSTSIGGGTRGYAPIEQAQYHDGHDFPVTMDVYALGGTLFKMLTGIVPPDSSSILNDGFPLEILLQAGVSPIVASLVEKMMSPIKKKRPQNMKQVISDILSISARIDISDKTELSKWIIGSSNPINVNNGDVEDETEIEIVSVNHEHFKSKREAVFDSSINKLEIKVILDPDKTGDYNWFSITATSKQFILIKSKKGEQHPVKKTFFFTNEKFVNLKNKLQALDLKCEDIGNEGGKSPYGIGLKTYKGNSPQFYATTYEDSQSTGTLSGHTELLVSIAWKESGLVSLDSISTKNSKLGKVITFVRSPRKWVGYLAIIATVIFSYVISDPIENYIQHTYTNDIIYSWQNSETSNYQLRADQGGTGGVLYTPKNQWAISPQYRRSNPDDVYISNGSFTRSGVEILSQKDDFALIEAYNSTNLFYNGAVVAELSSGDYGSVSRSHKLLYKITYRDINEKDYISSIYDKNGNVIIPFSDKSKSVIFDNVIKVYDYDDYKYFDITGKPINSFNIVVFYDKYGFWVNFMAVIILSLLLCVVSHFLYKVANKRGIFKKGPIA